MAVGVSSDVTVCVGVCDGVAAALAVGDAVAVEERVAVLERVDDAVGDRLGLVVCDADELCEEGSVKLRVGPLRTCVLECEGTTVGACVELLSSTRGDAD